MHMPTEKTGLRISGYRSIDPPSRAPIIVTLIVLVIAGPVLTWWFAENTYRAQIESLRAQLKLKETRSSGSDRSGTMPAPVKVLPIKSVILVPGISPLDLQRALSRAGFYTGPADGRLTKNVVDGLKEFQRHHAVRADGVLGKKTWQLLQPFKD